MKQHFHLLLTWNITFELLLIANHQQMRFMYSIYTTRCVVVNAQEILSQMCKIYLSYANLCAFVSPWKPGHKAICCFLLFQR